MQAAWSCSHHKDSITKNVIILKICILIAFIMVYLKSVWLSIALLRIDKACIILWINEKNFIGEIMRSINIKKKKLFGEYLFCILFTLTWNLFDIGSAINE